MFLTVAFVTHWNNIQSKLPSIATVMVVFLCLVPAIYAFVKMCRLKLSTPNGDIDCSASVETLGPLLPFPSLLCLNDLLSLFRFRVAFLCGFAFPRLGISTVVGFAKGLIPSSLTVVAVTFSALVVQSITPTSILGERTFGFPVFARPAAFLFHIVTSTRRPPQPWRFLLREPALWTLGAIEKTAEHCGFPKLIQGYHKAQGVSRC